MDKDLLFTGLFTVISIILYLTDVILDVYVAYKHARDGNDMFSILTIIFIVVPAYLMSGYSLIWYYFDKESVSFSRWVLRCISHILGLAPVFRNFEALYYGWKCFKCKTLEDKKKYKVLMTYENTDAAFLRLVECFMECAPQLVIQLCIIIKVQTVKRCISPSSTGTLQSISIFSSLVSLSWGLTSYLRFLRQSVEEKNVLDWHTAAVLFLWRFFEISSRVIVLALFASVFPYVLLLVCTVHFFIMFSWIRSMHTEFCKMQLFEFIYNIELGIVFLFCYFNPKDTPTRQRCIVFYVVMFLENVAMLSLWFNYSPDAHIKVPVFIIASYNFFFGILVMVYYYTLVHPTIGKIPWDKQEESNEISVQNDNADTTLSSHGDDPEKPGSSRLNKRQKYVKHFTEELQ